MGDTVPLPSICRETTFQGARYIACTIDPAEYSIRTALRAFDGKPYGSVNAFVEANTAVPMIAMNAGMYHDDLSPVGLYVEDGIEQSPLNLADAPGNFFLKPNGVFFMDKQGRAEVRESAAFASGTPAVRFATQSGPMLVVDSQIHPKFLPDGESRYTRNGIGVTPKGEVVLAISRDQVSLGAFARFFRDAADCPNALFFDGQVSALASGRRMVIDSGHPAGPIIAVFSSDQSGT